MARRSIKAGDQPPVPSERKAAQLCVEWSDLEQERNKLAAQARDRGKRQKEIKQELARFVDANKDGKIRSVALAKWRIEITQVKNSISWIAEFTKACGQAAVDKLKAAVGTHDDVEITPL